jgi:hypothetical protein
MAQKTRLKIARIQEIRIHEHSPIAYATHANPELQTTRTFKPSPRYYRHLGKILGLTEKEVTNQFYSTRNSMLTGLAKRKGHPTLPMDVDIKNHATHYTTYQIISSTNIPTGLESDRSTYLLRLAQGEDWTGLKKNQRILVFPGWKEMWASPTPWDMTKLPTTTNPFNKTKTSNGLKTHELFTRLIPFTPTQALTRCITNYLGAALTK